MSTEKKIKDMYNSTFSEVHASDELKGMVENMAGNKKILWKNALKKGSVVAAALALVFVSGNIVTYAATGNSLISYVSEKINGEEKDVKLEKKVDDKGNTYYHGHFEGDNNEEIEVDVSDEAEANDMSISIESTESDGDMESTFNVDIKPEGQSEVSKSSQLGDCTLH